MLNSIFLEPISLEEVFCFINTMNPNKSLKLKGISAYFIKIAANVIAVPVLVFCNFSFLFGIFQNV